MANNGGIAIVGRSATAFSSTAEPWVWMGFSVDVGFKETPTGIVIGLTGVDTLVRSESNRGYWQPKELNTVTS